MKRVDIKINNTSKDSSSQKDQHPHFIGSWNIENDILCEEIINVFEENKKLQNPGTGGGIKDLKVKKTTDISLTPNDLKNIKFKSLNDYMEELHKCYADYQGQWPFIKDHFKRVHIGGFNIQKYLPGDHFAKIHSERSELSHSHRIFAWMTYLNDVEEGGITNFPHYNIRVKPEVGKTLIWPAEWTHAHSGEILKAGVKYIVTGWMHFPYDDL